MAVLGQIFSFYGFATWNFSQLIYEIAYKHEDLVVSDNRGKSQPEIIWRRRNGNGYPKTLIALLNLNKSKSLLCHFDETTLNKNVFFFVNRPWENNRLNLILVEWILHKLTKSVSFLNLKVLSLKNFWKKNYFLYPSKKEMGALDFCRRIQIDDLNLNENGQPEKSILTFKKLICCFGQIFGQLKMISLNF